MRVAVTGSSGFIGSRFIDLYASHFSDVVKLNSRNAPLNDYNRLLEKTKGVNILVHTAFDHKYQQNLAGIKNVLKACVTNKIKKLVHISTISVYDPNVSGILNEETKYSKLNDPYSREKQKIEKEITKYKNKGIDIIILQPSIVYGIGGSWSKTAFRLLKSSNAYLPNAGMFICNAVYIDDVAQSIYKSCIAKDVKFDTFLISGYENANWKSFYSIHHDVLTALKFPSNLNVLSDINQNEFHVSTIKNVIFLLWFKTPIGYILNLFTKQLKSIRKKQLNNDVNITTLLQKDVENESFELLGITKKVHKCHFSIDISKAKSVLKYNSNFNLENGRHEIEKTVKNIVH